MLNCQLACSIVFTLDGSLRSLIRLILKIVESESSTEKQQRKLYNIMEMVNGEDFGLPFLQSLEGKLVPVAKSLGETEARGLVKKS